MTARKPRLAALRIADAPAIEAVFTGGLFGLLAAAMGIGPTMSFVIAAYGAISLYPAFLNRRMARDAAKAQEQAAREQRRLL